MTVLALAFGVSFGLGLTLTYLCERVAPRLGLVTMPREDRWHRRPIPLLGGVAMAVGMVPVLAWVGARGRPATLLLVAFAMAAVGLADDSRALRPQVKLVAQIVLAGLLIQFGFVLRLTGAQAVDVLLTLLWVVGITNAFNLLDNMDGLASGMALIAAAFRLAFFVLDGEVVGSIVTAAFMGVLTAFLVRNFPPAKIFMGDAGSLFIGFFLSGLSLLAESAAYSRGVVAVLLLPVLLMLIPIFDTTFVTVTRLITGRPVSQGGRDHTSHRLVALGVSERRALTLLYGVSVGAGLLAFLTYRYGFAHTVVLLVLLVVALILLGVYLSRVEVVRPGAGREDTAIVRLVADFPYKRHIATVLVDLVLIVVAYYAAYLLRFEESFEASREALGRTLAPVMVLQIASLAVVGAYRGLWRYTSVADLLRLLRGITLGSLASVTYLVLNGRFEGLSRAVFILDWMLLVLLLSAIRVSFRLFGELLRAPRRDFERILIYGAGDGGELTLREFRNNPALRRETVGFLDDDRAKVGTRIHEVPVLGGLDALEEVLGRRGITEVVIASRKIRGDRQRRLEAICAARGVRVVRASVHVE